MENSLAPIVLFVYNRPWHTRQTLEALSKNILADKSKLYIYADGPKEDATEDQLQKIKEVRELIGEKKWCGEVEIIERNKNIGIGNSEIYGITEIVNKFGKIIVMEDDVVTSIGFLKYMNEALDLYKDEKKVMHISGYMFPIKKKLPETFFYNATSCWGWGTWDRSWKLFNGDSDFLLKDLVLSERMLEFTLGNSVFLNSLLQQNASIEQEDNIPVEIIRSKNGWNWDVCWHTSIFLLNGFCLHPRKSLVCNIGHDATGVHCKNRWWSTKYNNQEIVNDIKVELIELIENKEARESVKKFYSSLNKPPLLIRIKDKIKGISKNPPYPSFGERE